MTKWLVLLGHSVRSPFNSYLPARIDCQQCEDLEQLNAIHVAGTNGKGSTCAFIASFLKVYGEITGGPRQIGLYTSPHMTSVCERIRINDEPISKELFTTRFFEIWNRLPKTATPELDIPRYLQLLALLSFHVFIKAEVDVAIFETHSGGQYDATNIIRSPIVTAISSIALDHVRTHGPTIQNIACHKAGIFKPGSIAISSHQDEEVAVVLRQRASEERVVSLAFVGIDPSSQIDTIEPATQKLNCSLALAVVHAWLKRKGYSIEHDFITRGIERFRWPGRYQIIVEQNCRWYLDGAHNEAGLHFAVEWFANAIKNDQQ
jgi:folylpolyglutamate synthase